MSKKYTKDHGGSERCLVCLVFLSWEKYRKLTLGKKHGLLYDNSVRWPALIAQISLITMTYSCI